MLDIIIREETLLNVIKSVTRNGKSILLTTILALILVYLFSVVGYLFLSDDFVMEVDSTPPGKLLVDNFMSVIMGTSDTPSTVSQMMTEGMESCAVYSEEELAVLTEDCATVWDEVKCACISAVYRGEESAAAPVVSLLFC